MESKRLEDRAPAPDAISEPLDTLSDLGISAVAEVPIEGILESVAEAASAAKESLGEAVGFLLDSL